MKHLVTYTTAKTPDIYEKKCKTFVNVLLEVLKPVPDFKKSVNMSCWRHYQENLLVFCG